MISRFVVHIPDTVVATLPSDNGGLARDLWKATGLRGIKAAKLAAY